jgi:hypothetical protein
MQASALKQQAKHVGLFEEVRPASVRRRRDANPGVEQTHEQIALPACAHRGEHTATPGIGGCRIGGHTTHDFIVFIEPDQVVRVERAAVGDEQRANVGGLRGKDGIPRGIDEAVRIGAVRQQQLDERAMFGRDSQIRDGSSSSIATTRSRSPSAAAIVRSYAAPRSRRRRAVRGSHGCWPRRDFSHDRALSNTTRQVRGRTVQAPPQIATSMGSEC